MSKKPKATLDFESDPEMGRMISDISNQRKNKRRRTKALLSNVPAEGKENYRPDAPPGTKQRTARSKRTVQDAISGIQSFLGSRKAASRPSRTVELDNRSTDWKDVEHRQSAKNLTKPVSLSLEENRNAGSGRQDPIMRSNFVFSTSSSDGAHMYITELYKDLSKSWVRKNRNCGVQSAVSSVLVEVLRAIEESAEFFASFPRVQHQAALSFPSDMNQQPADRFGTLGPDFGAGNVHWNRPEGSFRWNSQTDRPLHHVDPADACDAFLLANAGMDSTSSDIHVATTSSDEE
eukprot:ANDGO_03741.mRNA.1 hypothetical protein